MNRRKFVLGAVASGVAISGGATWLSIEKYEKPLDVDFALMTLDRLKENNPVANGEWNLYQVLIHCAQSVEYSMLGYPEHKSSLFKNTAGKAAFSLFSAKGKMSHALNEVIPGAPVFADQENVNDAVERFKKSLIDFKEYDGVLAPHFAYGELTKVQYEAAHVMHCNDHLQEIELTSVSA
mgnify:CR=1 FL=1